MKKNKILTPEQKRADFDIWIIVIITFSVFLFYGAFQKPLMAYVSDSFEPVLPRLLCNAAIQFGIAGLGMTAVCLLRKERFSRFGLVRKHALPSIAGTSLCFLPYLLLVFASGRFTKYQPFQILITQDVLSSGFPVNILGMALIVLVWGFFEGFNYAVISEKLNARYPGENTWLDTGSLTCGVVCILFHPLDLSLYGILEILTTFAAIYGMLIVRKLTGNAWGCIFAFCFIWNAI